MKFPRAAFAVAACLIGPLGAQPDQTIDRARKALAELCGQPAPDEAHLKQIVAAILAAGPGGLKLFRAQLQAADEAGDRKRRDRLFTAVGHIGFGWIGKVQKSGMVFAGQYDELKALMPHIGEFYLRLLLDTPEWFPITDRWKVVPAVRDLYPKGPDKDTIEQVQTMAQNEVEPEHLRVRLAYALAQWGHRELIKERLRQLEKVATGDDADAAVLAMRDLAAIHYGIRDYTVAALAHRDFLRRAEAREFALVPEYYYNTACCYCLIGDRRTAIQFIEKALKLNNSANIDSSVRLKRSLFENDPESKLARQDPRYRKLLDAAFGPKKSKPASRKTKDPEAGDARRKTPR